MASAHPCDLCDLSISALTVCMAPTTPSDPKFAVFGEAPGAHEDEAGEPFVGPSGRMLWGALKEHGLLRDDAFVSNVVKCRPPENRDPKVKELNACRLFLEAELDWLRYETKCKAILAVGSKAYKALGGAENITAANGVAFKYRGLTIVPTVHPSAVMHSPRFREAFNQGVYSFARVVNGESVSVPESEVILVNG